MKDKRVDYIELTKGKGWEQEFERDKEGNLEASHEQLRTSCYFRMAAAQEAQAILSERGLENQAKSVAVQEKLLALQERVAVAYEATMKDKIALLHEVRGLTVALDGQKGIVSDLSNSYMKIRQERDHLYRRIASLKGVITRMRKAA